MFDTFWLASLFIQVSSLVTKLNDLRGNTGLPLKTLLAKKFSSCVSYRSEWPWSPDQHLYLPALQEVQIKPPTVAQESTHHYWIIQFLEGKPDSGWVGFLEFLRILWKVIRTMSWSLPTSAPRNVLGVAVSLQDVVNLVVMCSTWAVPCPPSGWLMVAYGVCQHKAVVDC